MEFYDTVGGRRFIDGVFPKLIDAVERMAKATERANELKEMELRGEVPAARKEVAK